MATYTTAQVSRLTGASAQAIRSYTKRYAQHFSLDATPEPGQDRKYTADDVRLCRWIYGQTSAGVPHATVSERLADGAMDDYHWQPETDLGEDMPQAGETALVPVERLQAAHALLQDAQRRETVAQAKADALQAEIVRLNRELGEVSGKLAAQRRPAWWTRLFGGSD